MEIATAQHLRGGERADRGVKGEKGDSEERRHDCGQYHTPQDRIFPGTHTARGFDGCVVDAAHRSTQKKIVKVGHQKGMREEHAKPADEPVLREAGNDRLHQMCHRTAGTIGEVIARRRNDTAEDQRRCIGDFQECATAYVKIFKDDHLENPDNGHRDHGR